MKKVTVVTNADGAAVINTTAIHLQITMDNEQVIITEKAEIVAGLENPVVMQKPNLSLAGTDLGNAIPGTPQSEELKAKTSAFVNAVFELYKVYRKDISPILKANNPESF